MADNRTVVATIGRDKYSTSLHNGVHTVFSDEPQEMGGKDSAPTPGDYLRMSLASCTAITLRMYADRKGFNLNEIKVEVRSEQTEGKTIFYRQVYLSGDIDKEQRSRMLAIANACPVHKAMTNPISVKTVVMNQISEQ
jgi:putative redox protein